MLEKYKEVIKTLNEIITNIQPILTPMLEELQIIEAEEKATGIPNSKYATSFFRQLIIESNRIREAEFKLGFTLEQIRFTAVMIEGRRPSEAKEKPVNKLSEMLKGLSKEDLQKLIKTLE